MLSNRLYFQFKPYVPWHMRMALRRMVARRQRRTNSHVWPINEAAAQPPAGWPGWPDGKKFAFVLTHDVEGPEGLAKCRQLMQLEQELGFRSSFNFVPEGDYAVSRDLREELTDNGFEVGVHDLHHDGRLYRSRRDFSENAKWINHYLKEWGAKGFRSGFMLRNLDWLHDLDIQYDASTFDTDPFEPQPDGVSTIFPFWVPVPKGLRGEERGERREEKGRGYVQLPYTLPQDSTLFLLLGEQTPDIWLRKLDWIASHGGMVLLDTHPDYIAFNGATRKAREYPVEFYKRFLRDVQARYAGAYWNPLPNEVAGRVRGPMNTTRSAGPPRPVPQLKSRANAKPKIWIDLDNTPHVPFFEPIIDELRTRGYPLLVTARDAFQVCDLADKKGLKYLKIGRHYGKNRLHKVAGLAYRALQLSPIVRREHPALCVSHGARSQLLLGNCLGIPTLLLEDYEHAVFPPMMRPTWVMAPTVIPDAALCGKNGRIRKYPGIKEDVYAWKLKPDPQLLTQLQLGESDVIVIVRPPATEAHYHNPESERLFEAFMMRASKTPQSRIVLLPRNGTQADIIRGRWPDWFANGKTIIPRAAVDGMSLIWYSDLVVSGGGTMNREAAALGVPVYSIFRGSTGAVDQHLQSTGQLVMIESIKEVESRIPLVKRTRKPISEITSRKTLENIVEAIEEIADTAAPT